MYFVIEKLPLKLPMLIESCTIDTVNREILQSKQLLFNFSFHCFLMGGIIAIKPLSL